ncbi:hypothetical protein HBN50_05150 [Halobacteriovorax sp. GB3]|uniref:hypothetical protein n=1 Tax=Halobacteriovorax sp. GB3 TaxID=2719615 RepID=UPI0023616C27|nr:hypothetical protein [Halobacteriovorax sp. GB3]MDD0852472.1 hypothetical protein [Halobacteriovorax sp. GB3]
MKINKTILICASVLILIIGLFVFLKTEKKVFTQSDPVDRQIVESLSSLIGLNVTLGSFELDEKSKHLVMKDISIAFHGEEPFLIFEEGEARLGMKEQDQTVINFLEFRGIKKLTFFEGAAPGVSANLDLLNKENMDKFILELQDKINEINGDQVSSIIESLKVSKSELKTCKRSKRNCRKIKLAKKEKISKVLELIDIKKIAEKPMSEGGRGLFTISATKESLLAASFRPLLDQRLGMMNKLMLTIHKAFFDTDKKISHKILFKEIWIRDKKKDQNKEFVAGVKNLTSNPSLNADKTVFRMQGDIVDQGIRGVNLRLVIHKGKNNAVSVNGTIGQYPISSLSLNIDDMLSAQLSNLETSIKIKTFVLNEKSQGSYNLSLNNLEVESAKSEYLNLKKSTLVSRRVNSYYESSKDSQFLDVFIGEKSVKENNPKIVKSLHDRALKFILANEDFSKRYKAKVGDLFERLEKESASLDKIWPKDGFLKMSRM